jgi:hypothetical protein
MRQHTSVCSEIDELALFLKLPKQVRMHQHSTAYVSMRVSIRQHTSAYVSIRQHTSVCSELALFLKLPKEGPRCLTGRCLNKIQAPLRAGDCCIQQLQMRFDLQHA